MDLFVKLGKILNPMSAMDEYDLQNSPLSPTNLFDDYEEEGIDPCERCECKDESTCCGAKIVHTDICSDCGEHCSNWCDECEDNPNNK
jgi:hypothetical protein